MQTASYIQELRYIFHFSTGREIELIVKREKGQIPIFESSLKFWELNSLESKEYFIWRTDVAKDLEKELTEEERLLMTNFILNELNL